MNYTRLLMSGCMIMLFGWSFASQATLQVELPKPANAPQHDPQLHQLTIHNPTSFHVTIRYATTGNDNVITGIRAGGNLSIAAKKDKSIQYSIADGDNIFTIAATDIANGTFSIPNPAAETKQPAAAPTPAAAPPSTAQPETHETKQAAPSAPPVHKGPSTPPLHQIAPLIAPK